jgi:PAS domain S-box-containing protein
MERIEAAVAGSPQFFEWLHARLDGSQFLAEVSLNAVMLDQKAFLQAIVRDITDRRRMEEALRESAETFRALSENSQDVIIRFDREGRHLYVNAMAERRTGVPVAAHIGRTPAELGFPPALCDLWLDAIGEVVRRRSVHRVEYEFPQGSWIDWLLVPEFDADGEVNAVMTSARDFTERKLAEEDKAALERQLQHAQKMEVVGQLAGGVAHDFNNLLFVILGYLEILQPAVEGDPELTAGLQEISLAAERAAVLTRQLLAFSRKQAIKIVPLDLNEVVSQMLPMYDRVLSENISLQARLTGSLPKVMGDKGQIEQMLMNLVVNARDALPEGGHITVGTGTETLDAANCGKRMDVSPGAYAVLTISDDGSGMSRDVQERIFEPFFTTKPLGAGTGLGLSMVFGMMKQHGGHIEVDSERGRGSTFKLLFPALPASTGGHDSQESPGEPDLPGGDELLALVEDNAAVRVLGVRMLSQLGYRVLDYGSGEEALEALQGRAPSPDLLITDVMLTGLTGGVLAQRLKAVHPGLKVLFISGYPENILPVHGRVVGDTQLLLKPFAIGDLGRRVRAILDAD